MFKKVAISLGMLIVVSVAYTAISGEIKLDGVKCIINPKAAAKADKSADQDGGKVFFCCGNCSKKFVEGSKDNEALRAKARGQMVATGQFKQVKCPIAGRPINPAQKVSVAGVEVGLCCGGCKAKATKAKGDAQLQLVLGDKAFKKGFATAKKE